MKLGSIKINWSGIGANLSRAAYFGSHLVGSAIPPIPPPDSEAYPLYQVRGEWQDWADAETYVEDLVTPVFDVAFYGADPTGETDSTAAIQAAITACGEAGGGTVYIGEGLYTVWPTTSYVAGQPVPRCFNLYYPDVIIEGAGPTKTVLNARGPGGEDPADLYARGFTFTTLGTPRAIDNVKIRGMRATGNSPITTNAGDYGGEGSVDGWDTTHKFFAGFTNYTLDGFVFEFIEVDNHRGEQLYCGGTGLGSFTIRHCLIRDCNASAVSMGGSLVQEDCYCYKVLQGTENFCREGQSMIFRRNVVYPNKDLPHNMLIGGSGVCYHGFREASLLVEDCIFGYSYNGAVFCAEFASNVTIQDNVFEDGVGIYAINLNQYAPYPDAVPPEELGNFENHVYQRNIFKAATRDILNAIYALPEITESLLIDNNEIVNENGKRVLVFVNVSGPSSDYVISNNIIPDCLPVQNTDGYRPVFTGNTVTGGYEYGTVYASYSGPSDTDPLLYSAAWPRQRINDIGGGVPHRQISLQSGVLALLPDAYAFELRRMGANDSGTGAEVKPDLDENSLPRGYILYTGAVLTFAKNGTTGLLDLAEWVPNTVNVRTLTQSVSVLNAYGQTSVNLSPTVAHAYTSFAGIPIGETVEINHNANVTINHSAGVMETPTGSDFVASGSGTLSACRVHDGTLMVGTHPDLYDGPLIGVAPSGDPRLGEHFMDVTIVEDIALPAATDGYYSIERKQEGAWAEVAQVAKGEFAGDRLTASYTDEGLGRGEVYHYRCRAVSPGSPDVISRYSNTVTKTTLIDNVAPTKPVNNTLTVTDITSNSATLRATFLEAGGTAYWYVSTSATPPADITDSAGAVAWYSSTPALGVNTQAATGLSAGTTYYHHVAHADLYQMSAVATGAAWATSTL